MKKENDTWFTSDTHFGHKNIIKYCLRGYGTRAQRKAELEKYGGDFDELEKHSKYLFSSVADMNRVMRERWNERVKPDHTVYLIGDFAMGNERDWQEEFDQLNGIIHLIKGNHDCNSKWEVKKEILKLGFASISEQLFVEHQGYKLWMAHIPHSFAPDKRGYERPAPTEDYDIALSGHVHDKYIVNDFGNINVGSDNYEYYPQSLDELLESASKAEIFDSSQYLPV